MRPRYCYWSVVDGEYARMMETAIESAGRVGVFKDFHVWADRPVAGAVHHAIQNLDKSHYLFKLIFLHKEVQKLNFDYFVRLDADTYFVRHPGDVLRVLQGAPVHASLESDTARPGNVRADWWDCPLLARLDSDSTRPAVLHREPDRQGNAARASVTLDFTLARFPNGPAVFLSEPLSGIASSVAREAGRLAIQCGLMSVANVEMEEGNSPLPPRRKTPAAWG